MNRVKHPAVENTRRSCRKDFFLGIKCQRLCQVMLLLELQLSFHPPVNSVGSFLKEEALARLSSIWWVKRICSLSENRAKPQHTTEMGNNRHQKWILLWRFKYFYWLLNCKIYLSLLAGLSNPLLFGKVPKCRLEDLRNFHWVWLWVLWARCGHCKPRDFEKPEFPTHTTLIVNYSSLVKNICCGI